MFAIGAPTLGVYGFQNDWFGFRFVFFVFLKTTVCGFSKTTVSGLVFTI